MPGGGPALVMQTVEQDFAVPVHYFAQVDFNGFRRIVDALGGVTVDVQRPLIDNEYPADYGYAYQRVYIPAGIQHMDGRRPCNTSGRATPTATWPATSASRRC